MRFIALRPQVLVEIVVVGLALLPAGGDGRDVALDPQLGHGRAQRRIEALRAEQDHGAGLGLEADEPAAPSRLPHRARTRTVRPTKSSMARSSS